MPTGWVRASLSGGEAALLGWAIPAMLGVMGLLAQGTNPWFQQMNVATAASIGTDFWSLSLGAPMSIGGLPISLMPLLWTAIEVLMLRGLLWSGRNGQPSAQWFAVPAYSLVSAVILIASPGKASVGAVIVGAATVAAVAAVWAVVAQTEDWPAWVTRLDWIWRGIGYSLVWFAVAVVVGLVAFLSSVYVSRDAMTEAHALLGATGFSSVILWLTQSMYALVFASWGLAWLAGPGFTLSGDSISSSSSISTSPLPAFPVAQTVPTTAPGGATVMVLVLVGALIGALTGWWLRKRPTLEAAQSLLISLLGFSFLIGAWFALSTGALGSELMAHLGPTPTAWPLVVLELGLTAAFVAVLVQGGVIRGVMRLIKSRPKPETKREAGSGFEPKTKHKAGLGFKRVAKATPSSESKPESEPKSDSSAATEEGVPGVETLDEAAQDGE